MSEHLVIVFYVIFVGTETFTYSTFMACTHMGSVITVHNVFLLIFVLPYYSPIMLHSQWLSNGNRQADPLAFIIKCVWNWLCWIFKQPRSQPLFEYGSTSIVNEALERVWSRALSVHFSNTQSQGESRNDSQSFRVPLRYLHTIARHWRHAVSLALLLAQRLQGRF